MAGGTLEAAQVSTQGEALKKLTEHLNESSRNSPKCRLIRRPSPGYRKAAAAVAELERQLEPRGQHRAARGVEYQQAVNREAMLKKAVAETKAEFDRLNARSFEYQALEARSRRRQEAVRRAGAEDPRSRDQCGIPEQLDPDCRRGAPAAKPRVPQLRLNVLLAFLFSSVIGVCAAVVSEVLDKTVRDPEVLARALNVDVVGTLPLVKEWRRHITVDGELALVRAENSPAAFGSNYSEAIRTLRSSILLSDFDRRLRTMMVTSSAPAEGKSTIAAHLAMAHAEQGRKTLLIDGDLRRPSVHAGSISRTGPAFPMCEWRRMWRGCTDHLADPLPTLRRPSFAPRRGPGRSGHSGLLEELCGIRHDDFGLPAAAGFSRAATDGIGGRRCIARGGGGSNRPGRAYQRPRHAAAAAGKRSRDRGQCNYGGDGQRLLLPLLPILRTEELQA